MQRALKLWLNLGPRMATLIEVWDARVASVCCRGRYPKAQGDWKVKVELPCQTCWDREGAQHTFTMNMRNKFVRETWRALWLLLSVSHKLVGTAITELGSLNAIRIIGSQIGREQELALNRKMRGGHSYHDGQWSQGNNHYSLTHRDLWH